MGGGGGKGGGGATDTASSRAMADLAKQIFSETTPLRQTMEAQGLEALKTGGTSASIPSVQRAVESSKVATSNALRQTGDSLSSAGLGGTPYGEAILANTGMQGEMAGNQAANAIGQAILSMVPALLTGQQATGASLFQSAAGVEGGLGAANTQAGAAKGAAQLGFLGKMLVG